MKIAKKLLAILIFAVLFGSFTPAAVFADDINVTINGQLVNFSGQAPAIIDGRTLVPIRAVFEGLGFTVDWNAATESATISSDGVIMIITVGSDSFTVNGNTHQLDVPAQVIGGSVLVPLRQPLEALGFDLDWDAASRTIVIANLSRYDAGFLVWFNSLTPADTRSHRIFQEPDPNFPGQNLFGIRDAEDNILVPAIYQRVSNSRVNFNLGTFTSGHPFFLPAQNPAGMWGVIDMRGNVVIPFLHESEINIFHSGSSPSHHLFAVRGNGTIINISNEIIFDNTSTTRPGVVGQDFIFISNGSGQNHLADMHGEIVLQLGDLRANSVVGTQVIVSNIDFNDRRFGVIENFTGNSIIPMIYNEISTIGSFNNVFAFRDESFGSWGVIDIDGNVIMSANYRWDDIFTILTMRQSSNREYIAQNFTGAARVHWFDQLRAELGTKEMEILCLHTGRIARARSIANGNHADINGTTPEYHEMLASFGDVLVRVDGKVMPAAMARFAPSTHFCLHFYGSVQNNNGRSWGDFHIDFGERASELIAEYLK